MLSKINDRRLLRKYRGHHIDGRKIVGVQYRDNVDREKGYIFFICEDEFGENESLEHLEEINCFIRKQDYNPNQLYSFVYTPLRQLK